MLRELFGLVLGSREPTMSGSMSVRGVRARISLCRDRHGVAYVEAQNDADAFFGLGFCQAQDRAFQLELLMRVGRGTLSEIVGADMLDVDRLSRRVGFERIAVAQLAVCDERTQEQLDAFAAGVNAGLERGRTRKAHELSLLRVEPSRFRPTDPLALLQFVSFALSTNWDAELARLRVLRSDGPEALMRAEPSLETWRGDVIGRDRALADVKLLEAAEELVKGLGALRAQGVAGGASNNWAIAGSRTQSGRPLVANDPHMGPSLPAPWYLAHVRTPAWAMTGAYFVSQPVPSIGHNEHGAWAVTSGQTDTTDLFVERVGPDGASVLDKGRFVRCEVREERIRVKGAPDVVEKVLITPRGPVVGPALGERRDALSLRGTWMAARPVGAYQIFRTENVEEMRKCFSPNPALSESRVFADVTGSIVWQMTGDLPARRAGSGLLPAPGWDESAGWDTEPLPFEALPHERDPARGWVASANQRPDTANAPGIGFLGVDFIDAYRYQRIAQMLDARSDWTVDAVAAMQLDRFTLLWPEVRDALLAAAVSGSGADLAVARRRLEGWDGNVAPDSVAASIFELAVTDLLSCVARAAAPAAWKVALDAPLNALIPHTMTTLRRHAHLSRLLREQPDGYFAQGWTHEIREALADAVRVLRARHGDDELGWTWGVVRPLTLRHPFGTKAPLARIFGLPDVAIGGDATTIPQASVDPLNPFGDPVAIANLRVVMDVGAWENSRYVVAGGQSGNPCSPHFGDLLPLWEKNQGIAIAWSRDEVRRRAVSTLVLESG